MGPSLRAHSDIFIIVEGRVVSLWNGMVVTQTSQHPESKQRRRALRTFHSLSSEYCKWKINELSISDLLHSCYISVPSSSENILVWSGKHFLVWLRQFWSNSQGMLFQLLFICQASSPAWGCHCKMLDQVKIRSGVCEKRYWNRTKQKIYMTPLKFPFHGL